MRRTLVVIALGLVGVACGSRGAPLSPIKKLPPPLPEVAVAQRGNLAIVTFGRFPQEITVEGAPVRTARVELLATSEQYPALTPEILAAALDRERRTRLREAREAATMATTELERRREAAAAAAAAEEAAAAAEAGEVVEIAPDEPEELEEPEEPEDDEADLTPDELAFRAVPRTALNDWEAAGLKPEVILDAARRLQVAVDLLWNQLQMPAAIVDLRQPPALPDPATVVRESERLLRALPYETLRPIEEFLRDAVVVASVDYEDLEPLRVGSVYELPYALEVPGASSIRTRYQLAVRGVSEADKEGAITQLLGIAPAPVSSAPGDVTTGVNIYGVELEWQPPVLDLAGRPLDSSAVRYRLYRRPSGNTHDLVQLTPEPIDSTALIDNTVTWGEAYIYEVRVEERPPWAPRLQIPRPNLTTVPPPGATTATATAATAAAAQPATPTTEATPVPTPGAAQAGQATSVEPLVQLPTLDEINRVTAMALAAAAAAPPPAVPPPASAVRRQSAPATSAEVLALDSFAPPPVTRLEAVRAGTRVTLRWAGSSASDLAGYRVYRHRVPAPEVPRISGLTDATEREASAPETAVEEGQAQAGEILAGAAQAGQQQAEQGAQAEQEEAQAEETELRPRDRRAQRQAEERQSRSRNALVDAGWELVTAVAIVELRYIDPASDPDVAWVYVVEALDRAGNVSTPVGVTVAAEGQ